MIRRPPRSTRTDTSFPTRRSSDLPCRLVIRWAGENTFGAFAPDALNSHQEYRVIKEGLRCIPFLDGPLLLFSEDEVFFHVAPLAIRRCNGRELGCLRPSFGCGVDGQVKFRQTNIDAVVRLSVLAGLLGRLELDAFDSVVALEEQLGVFAPFFACGLGLANIVRALARKSTRLNSSH